MRVDKNSPSTGSRPGIAELRWAKQHPEFPDWARPLADQIEQQELPLEIMNRDEIRRAVHQMRRDFHQASGSVEGDRDNGSVVRDYSGSHLSLSRLNGPVHTLVSMSSNGWFQFSRADISGQTSSYRVTNSGLFADQPEQPATMPWSQVLEELTPPPFFREVYVNRTASMADLRKGYLTRLREGFEKLPPEEGQALIETLESGRADVPRKLWSELKHHHELRSICADWRSLEEVSSLSSDGMTRTSCHWTGPGALTASMKNAGWEMDRETGLPIADAVIVGGGPGGLATAAQLKERGLNSVLFEGGYLGQSFSDQGAAAVHRLRTSVNESELFPSRDNHPASLFPRRIDLRVRCQEARRDWSQLTGATFEELNEDQRASLGPIERSEFHSYLAEIGRVLNEDNTFICEQSPVTTVTRHGQLYKVRTEPGHEVLCRNLVVATGMVESHGANGRLPDVLEDLEGVTRLMSDHDLMARASDWGQSLEKQRAGEGAPLVCGVRLLARPSVLEYVQQLGKQARVAVVGAGESGVKAAIELLELHPGISVDLYASETIGPYQFQVPSGTLNELLVEEAYRNPGLAADALEKADALGAPVTNESWQKLIQFESAGRLRMRELGEHFDAGSVAVARNGSKLSIDLVSENAAESLRRHREELVASGLYGKDLPSAPPTFLPEVDMVVVATGYQTHTSGLMRMLEQEGAVTLDRRGQPQTSDGIASQADPNLFFNTAGVVYQPADTTLLARELGAGEIARRIAGEGPKEPSSNEELSRFLLEYPIHPGVVRSGAEVIEGAADERGRNFNRADWSGLILFGGATEQADLRSHHSLKIDSPEWMTPAEKLTESRARQVLERLGPVEGRLDRAIAESAALVRE